MSETPAVDFWFDFSSPYSYIANEWIDALAARHGRVVRRHALLLGVTFQAAELKSPVSYPLKREYVMRDFARSARFEGLPYEFPATFPQASHNAARVFWWLKDTQGEDAARAWCQRLFRAVFARGHIISDPTTLATLAAEHGLDPAVVASVCADPRWKDRLRQVCDQAVAQGIFGAPFFQIDGEPFWGNDRKAQMERWLAQGPY